MFTSAPDERREPGSWSPSPLRRLFRHRGVYWSIALALAVTAGVVVHDQGAVARRTIARLGTTTDLVMAEDELAPGEPIASHAVVVAVPIGLAPAGALTEIPVDGVAGRRVPRGALLTQADLADSIGPGPDEAAIAVGASAATPPTAPGDSVLLVLAADPFSGLVARTVGARVVGSSDDRVVVAVARRDLPDVATALQLGGVTVALG